ncbi:9886_t:CDS:2, partial [Ambispora leptoticha]
DHKYFDRKCSEWNILEFLDECELEPFGKKIECYLTSLEVIANCGTDRRRQLAQLLLDQYKQASFEPSHEAGIRAYTIFEVVLHSRLRADPVGWKINRRVYR